MNDPKIHPPAEPRPSPPAPEAVRSSTTPWEALLEHQGVVVLDGGLASELEFRGLDLSGRLWSARWLSDGPEEIVRVHRDFLEAGADCIIAASYQVSFEGLRAEGFDDVTTETLLRRSVALACRARDDFWSDPARPPGRLRPLVAASVGPYGAILADGSEYRGDYGLDEAALLAFHRRRFEILADAGADLLACETLPSLGEARALARLLADTPGARGWIAFSCRDDRHLSDGTAIERAIAELASTPGLVALGVNCTAPRHLSSLLARAADHTDLPLVAYPNAGELWDATARRWCPAAQSFDLATAGREWHALGARFLGGCCRIRPADIAGLRRALVMC